MKKLLIILLLLGFVQVCNAADFYGALFRLPVNESVKVAWDAEEVTGYQIKMVHYFYSGLETAMVEVVDPFYTFNKFPKSSRHFEIYVRCFVEGANGSRLYSDWAVSSNAACSLVDNVSSGWLVYTSPAAPVW